LFPRLLIVSLYHIRRSWSQRLDCYNDDMQISDYSTQAISTDLYDKEGQAIDSHAMLEKVLGLVGEAGEVAEKFKKILRDKNGQATPEDKKELAKELGDILWYINSVGIYLGFSLEEIAQNNLDKVLSRRERGVTQGSGDNR